MSDNIPFDIQMEIIKWLPVKPLIQFRSVSKPWKSFIDRSQFIKGYGARHTQPRSHILMYRIHSFSATVKYIRLVEDDKNETFKVQKHELAPVVVSPLIKNLSTSEFIGTCHGLVCLFGLHKGYDNGMLVIWNPSIGKSFGIIPKYALWASKSIVYAFGVCPLTSDPTIVKVLCADEMQTPCHVEVFTLSSGVWNVIPSGNLPRQMIKLNWSTHVVIDRFIYWGACEKTFNDIDEAKVNVVVSFDLITKEFKVVELPDCLAYKPDAHVPVSVSKLRESLVVYRTIYVEGVETCSVWVMRRDSSFKKLFLIGARVVEILGFMESGEPILNCRNEYGQFTRLVYDPRSQQTKNLEISGEGRSFFMDSYNESLLLLDHSDLHVYSGGN